MADCGMSLPDLKTIKDRCHEYGSCWLWAQNCNSAGYPMASHEGKQMLVRRRSFQLFRDRLPDGRKRAIIPTCRNKLCVNPEHLLEVSRSTMVKQSYKQTRNLAIEYKARHDARVRQGGLKLTMELARELRATAKTETAKQAAARLGCSASLVQKVRQGHHWREHAKNSSVFNIAA